MKPVDLSAGTGYPLYEEHNDSSNFYLGAIHRELDGYVWKRQVRWLNRDKVHRWIAQQPWELLLRSDSYKGKSHYKWLDCLWRWRENCFLAFESERNMPEVAHCVIFYHPDQLPYVDLLTRALAEFRTQGQTGKASLHILTTGIGGIEVTSKPIQATRRPVLPYYLPDFQPVYQRMVAALRKPKRHGLIVLHGAPGTGKTELIRHLVGKVRRRKFLYLPNSLAQELDGPRLLNVLAEHAGSVLVVEEAEQLLRPRTVHEGPSAVSGLLNLTDGLLRDFLNYIVICTFNSPLAEVDPALLRNGRLIAEYQFGPLPVPQVAAIAHQHNLDLQPTTPMTLADIFRAPALRQRSAAKARVGFVTGGQAS